MIAKGLVSNGVKTYITGLESDPIESCVSQLQDLAKETASGGSAYGQVSPCSLLAQVLTDMFKVLQAT